MKSAYDSPDVVAAAIIIGSVILINSARQVKVKTQRLQAVAEGDD